MVDAVPLPAKQQSTPGAVAIPKLSASCSGAMVAIAAAISALRDATT